MHADRPSVLDALPFRVSLLGAATSVALNSRLHGPRHWEQVAINGLAIGYQSEHKWREHDPDLRVILAFALIHDAFRETDADDPNHGARAAAWAQAHEEILDLDSAQSGKLLYALNNHNHPRSDRSSDLTVGACWDADRLDLPRVGTIPDARYFSTAAGERLRRTTVEALALAGWKS